MNESSGARRSKSLIWKLVFIQVRRLIGIFAKINFVIILLCATMIFWWAEWQVRQIVFNLQINSEYRLLSAEISEEIAIPDVLLDTWVGEALGLALGNRRGFDFTDKLPQNIMQSEHDFTNENLHYIANVQAMNDKSYQIRLDLGTPLIMLSVLLAAIIFLEIWYTAWTLFSARRSVRRALQPIYELTVAAQSASVEQSQPIPVMPIPLDGAINALNAINEEHMDHRILIEDERDELQGLAMAINNMLDRLNAAYQSQLRFVSDASHELRTPIAIIQGYANLLGRWGKDDPKTLQESIDAIKSEAVGMQALIEQLLFLARSDNRSIPMRMERVELSALVSEVARESRMLATVHTIEESIEPDVFVKADLQLLKQSMRIFVDNAVKYSPDGGRIIIGLKRDGGNVQLRVTDHGNGIAEEDLPMLFERFWRADESRTRKTGGTGLGLSIAKWIVDSHNGQIEVISREGMGTRMSVILPIEEAQEPAPPQKQDDANSQENTQSA